MKKLILFLILIPFISNAQLPTVDISTDHIRTALGLTGETTFQAMCTASNVTAAGLNPTYCPGADAAARLTNLQSTPYDIGKFRGYTHSAGCSLSVTPLSLELSSATPTGELTLTASGSWTCVRTGSTTNSLDFMSGTGNRTITATWNQTVSGTSTFTFSSTGCSNVVMTVFSDF